MSICVRYYFFAIISFLPALVKADMYVVVVGIANYQHISRLNLSENDALTISRLYKTKTNNVITITGRYATRANIIKAMSDQYQRAKENDMIVFYFSGHGYKGGFCPYNMGRTCSNALSYQDIYAIFRHSKAKRKVIIADACMSGGLRQQPQTRNHSPEKSASNVLLFLSSRTKESSIENKRMKNGFFTAYLERGLRGGADINRDKRITAKELYSYVSKGVQALSKDKQHPVMWGNFEDNFIMMDWR